MGPPLSPPEVPRTYDGALTLLAQLQSNRTITNLFAQQPPADPSAAPAGAAATTKPDLNAAAIPEMLAWLARAGHAPSDLARLRCVHVAGTKGKGSTSAFVAGVLARYPAAAGRVGLYTSPHVVDVRERIVLDGRPVARELFGRYFFEVWDAMTEAAAAAGDVVPDGSGGLEGPATKPFYFRFLTILAFHVFLREGVRSAVVECGIGGEYDATNVLPAEAVTAAVVTQLGIDHVAMLGDTVPKIAWHKAGVFKRGVPAFTRTLPGREDVMEVLRARAAEKGALLEEMSDERVRAWAGIQGTALQGPFQKENMALAVMAARQHLISLGQKFGGEFGRPGYPLNSISEEFVLGLKSASLRGRGEVIQDGHVEWFVDGAHTVDSLAGVREWFAENTASDPDGTKHILVFNQQEREPTELLKALLERSSTGGAQLRFDQVIFPRNDEDAPRAGEEERDLTVQKRAYDALKKSFPSVPGSVQSSVRETVDLVRSLAQGEDGGVRQTKVLVTGSFYHVGSLIKILERVSDK